MGSDRIGVHFEKLFELSEVNLLIDCLVHIDPKCTGAYREERNGARQSDDENVLRIVCGSFFHCNRRSLLFGLGMPSTSAERPTIKDLILNCPGMGGGGAGPPFMPGNGGGGGGAEPPFITGNGGGGGGGAEPPFIIGNGGGGGGAEPPFITGKGGGGGIRDEPSCIAPGKGGGGGGMDAVG